MDPAWRVCIWQGNPWLQVQSLLSLQGDVEISGFFGDLAVSCDVILEAVLWEDVFLRQTLEKSCDIWKEYALNPTDSEWCFCLGLPNDLPLLVFACCDFMKRNAPKNFSWYSDCFLLFLWTCANLAESFSFYWIMCGVCRLDWTVAADSCLMFWTGLLISWQ